MSARSPDAGPRLLYVIPYPEYFRAAGTRLGGHIAHAVGIIDAFVDAGWSVEVLSDAPIPGYERAGVVHVPLAGARLRAALRRLARGARGASPSSDAAPTSAPLRGALKGACSRGLFLLGLTATATRRALATPRGVVYVRHYLDAWLPLLAARVGGLPSVLEVNTPCSMPGFTTPDAARRGRAEPRRTWRERAQYLWAGATVVVSPALRDWIGAVYGEGAARRVLVLPNGVDPGRFSPRSPDPRLRARFGAGPGDVLVGVAAAFAWYNAVDQLLDAVRRARVEEPRIRLVLFGAAAEGRDLRAVVAAGDVQGIAFAGPSSFDAMPDLLAACDVLVSYCDFQGVRPHQCSIKHLEYMAAGRAVIAAEAETFNFAVRDGETGLVVPQGDPARLADALVRLARDAALRGRLAGRAREEAARLHSWRARVDALLEHLGRSAAPADSWGTRPWFEAQFARSDPRDGDAWGHRWRGSQRLRHARTLALAVSALGAGPRDVLDVGCAAGDLTSRLAARDGARVVAVDVAGAALTRSRACAPGARHVQAALPDLPFADASFDLVVAAEVVYYLPADARERAYDELKRVLRSGGHLVFTAALDDGARYGTAEAALHALRRRFFVVEATLHPGRLLARFEAPLLRMEARAGRIARGEQGGAAALVSSRSSPLTPAVRTAARVIQRAARAAAGNTALSQGLLALGRVAGPRRASTHLMVVARKTSRS